MTQYPLILLCGFSGSGKTTAAKALEKAFDHCVALNPEKIRKGLGITKYSRADTPYVISIEMIKLGQLWAQGKTGIVDNNLLSPILRQMFYDLARDEGRKTLLISCHAPMPVLEKRISDREYIEGGPPHNHNVLQSQRMFWGEPVSYDALLNDPELVTIVNFNTEKQSVLCIHGNIIPYYQYLRVLVEIKNRMDEEHSK